VAARNLLVDSNMSVRVADFGMSRIKQPSVGVEGFVGHTDSNFGPLKWMSQWNTRTNTRTHTRARRPPFILIDTRLIARSTDLAGPEAILKHEYSEKSDAFSFGVCLWEILVRRPPYEGLRNLAAAVRVAQEDSFRLPIPREVPRPMADIMADCWRANPAQRPNFRQLLIRLQRYLQSEAPELIKPLVIDYAQLKTAAS
jgi:serine/threonine protein kinase